MSGEGIQIPRMARGWKLVAAWHNLIPTGNFPVERAGWHVYITSRTSAWDYDDRHGYGSTLAEAIWDAIDKQKGLRSVPDQTTIANFAAALTSPKEDK